MAFRQSINANSSATGPVSTLSTTGINTKPGSLVCVGFVTSGSITVASVADSFNNQWTPHPLNPQSIPSHNTPGWAWFSPSIQAGNGHTFTVNTVGTGTCSMVVFEFTGLDAFNPLVATGGATETLVVASHVLGTIATTQDGCDIFAFNFDDSSLDEGVNPGTGWFIPSNARNSQGSLYRPCFGQFMQGSAKGTYTNTWNSSQTSQGGSLIFAFKQPSYTFIQQTSASSAAASTSVTAGVSPEPTFTGGNLLLYVAKYNSPSQQIITVTDLLSNQYTEISNFYDGAVTHSGYSWGIAKSITGGPDNITAAYGGQSVTAAGIYVAEFSGLDQVAPFGNGGTSFAKIVSPGATPDSIQSGFTPQLGRQPALVFGFTTDGTNSSGQTLSPGTGYNGLPQVWLFGSGQATSLPEHKRVTAFDPVQATATPSNGTDTYFQLVIVLSELNAQSNFGQIVSSGVFVCP